MVPDGVARAPEIEMLRALAQVEGAQFFVVMTECSDPELHRTRVDSRHRGIPDRYEIDWSSVERSRKSWDPDLSLDLRIDSAKPMQTIERSLYIHFAPFR